MRAIDLLTPTPDTGSPATKEDHMPGPWYWSTPCEWLVQRRGHRTVWTSCLQSGASTWRPADARLIAAAPELLEACRRSAEYLEQLQAAGVEDCAELAAELERVIGRATKGDTHD